MDPRATTAAGFAARQNVEGNAGSPRRLRSLVSGVGTSYVITAALNRMHTAGTQPVT